MFPRWANARLRMQAIRQKYFTFMRKNVNSMRSRAINDMKRTIFRGTLYTIVIGGAYLYGN